jgi:ribonuclease VapC
VPEAEPASILDASALIALLHAEPGSDAVLNAIADGAAMSVVNWAETLSKVAADGDDPQTVATAFDGMFTREQLTDVDCIEIARLRPLTRRRGLSLADRACLALGARLGIPVLTADRDWADLNIGITVQLIR